MTMKSELRSKMLTKIGGWLPDREKMEDVINF